MRCDEVRALAFLLGEILRSVGHRLEVYPCEQSEPHWHSGSTFGCNDATM